MGEYFASRAYIFFVELLCAVLFLMGALIFLWTFIGAAQLQPILREVGVSREARPIAIILLRSLAGSMFVAGFFGVVGAQLVKAVVDTAHVTKKMLAHAEQTDARIIALLEKLVTESPKASSPTLSND